ncbi:ImmA/IrrE family metallo-endopeptidase [Rhizorhabdus wittichii]|uniref:ImmA/IrrE family metallo-endopeptidase n=1 Tax=Rhizorhabdus wittichii TaxID=160791 RepID=UPI00037834B6|nr:ImmA/IrrE family metallo-endopeptidase [Rhizorhabdus wittichii]
MLDQVYADGVGRFPVDVPVIARDFSAHRFAGDALTLVKGANLGKFDGALYRAPAGKSGWGIIYNDSIASKGRINFTLAHEFGHYLLHRLAHPNGIECGQQDMVRWDLAYREIEQQANCFAAGLLMPLNDFRTQIPAKARPTFHDLAACGERYGVSLIAATLRWIEYAERRSVLVVSRDGFILWARSSKSALKTGAYYRTVNRAPIEVPMASLAAIAGSGGRRLIAEHDDAWFGEPSTEVALVSDNYDFTISLVHLDDAVWRSWDKAEEEADTFDLMRRR